MSSRLYIYVINVLGYNAWNRSLSVVISVLCGQKKKIVEVVDFRGFFKKGNSEGNFNEIVK